jgi:hypothetical protein
MDLIKGGVLQIGEALSVGMPFEVWKTYMGSNRTETTMQAFRSIYSKGGVGAFWKGWQPKVVESFLKGGILLFSKETIIKSSKSFGAGDVAAGVLGGFGGGICQVSIMGPCTFLVTASVAGASAEGGNMSILQRISTTYKKHGINGFYKGGTALMLRQGSNWASRQGFTDYARKQILIYKQSKNDNNNNNPKLTVLEEAIAGTIGGTLSAWNQPFEVMRIDAQLRAAKGLPSQNIIVTSQTIIAESGLKGLFIGIIPRIGLCVGQTLFMVTIPYILKPYGF